MRQLGHGWSPEAHHASFEHTPRRIAALVGERVVAVEVRSKAKQSKYTVH